jgi:hypothetical protein
MNRLIALLICTLTMPALAVNTSHWVHTSEADFKAGKFENTVATNLGDVKLSRALKTLLEQDPHVSSVYCMVEAPDKTIYAGTGPDGIILQIKDDKVSTFANLEGSATVFSLLIDKEGHLLAGTGGDKGRILRFEKAGEAPKELFSAKEVQYIWAMRQMSDGAIVAATGPNGQLFEISPDGKSRLLFDSDERNLMSMTSDGGDVLYVGTDPNGLVYRINRKTGEAFVLYDAAETEISALALDGNGILYAATAQAIPLPNGAENPGMTEQVGRPESSPGVPIPSQPPGNPNPPALPDPNPGEPEPIPKQSSDSARIPLHMDILPEDDGQAPPEQAAPPQAVTQEAEQPQPAAQPSLAPNPNGNAIYRIDRDGFVNEIFRQPATVLAMLEQNGILLVGTGDEGRIYQVNPQAEETTVLAKVDPKQVVSLLAASDGRIFMGLANVGGIAAMSGGFAEQGTYTSAVLDATQISRLGKIQLRGTLPKSTTLQVQTRSGNVHEPGSGGWSDWSQPVSAQMFVKISSPTARFFQYRLLFGSENGKESPVVDSVDVSYQIPNLAPHVSSVRSTSSSASNSASIAPSSNNGRIQVTWEAADPNSDPLQFSLYFRQNINGPWILLKDKMSQSSYEWDTRQVADGRYWLKIEASDVAANEPGAGRTSSRVSDPIQVDNTAPMIGDLKWLKQPGGVKVTFRVVDHTSTVASAEFSVDSSDNWQAVFPSDNIFDSPDEAVEMTAKGMGVGPHQITVRATDSHGNTVYENVLVTVDKPADNGR